MNNLQAEFSRKTDIIYWSGFALIALSNTLLVSDGGVFIILLTMMVMWTYGSTYLMEQPLSKVFLDRTLWAARGLFLVAILTGFIGDQPSMFPVTTFSLAMIFHFIAIRKLQGEVFKFMIEGG